MKDFKKGDEAWFFTDSGCNQLDICDMDLSNEIVEYSDDCGMLGTESTEVNADWCFKSKDEAIDALIEHLESQR